MDWNWRSLNQQPVTVLGSVRTLHTCTTDKSSLGCVPRAGARLEVLEVLKTGCKNSLHLQQELLKLVEAAMKKKRALRCKVADLRRRSFP